MKSFTAGKNENGVRLSRFVQSVTNNLPTSILYKSFRNKRIKINGKRGEADTRLNEGDLIELYINDEFFAQVTNKTPTKKAPKLEVVYEDENICIMYKPAHLLCHSDRTGDVSLVDSFIAYLENKNEYDKSNENRFTPALCNRLDRGTEGLVLGAKNYTALRDLNEIIRNDNLKKEYLTITVGVPPRGVHKAYLRHNEKNNKVSIRKTTAEDYKEILTEVKTVKQKGPFSLCRIGLLTGRTHQIRAHLAFLGAPVLGDIKYGNRKMNERCATKTQYLCAVKVSFKNISQANSLFYLNDKEIELKTSKIISVFEHL